MFPYWLLFTIFAAGSIQYRRRGVAGTGGAPGLAIAGFFIALMIGFRYRVGGDWVAYQRMYDSVLHLKLSTTLGMADPGYMLLNWIAISLGAGIWLVNLICGVIFSWGLVKFAKRQPNPWLAIAVAVPYLIIVVAMGYARQGVAIGFILAALADVERRSVLRFAIYMLLAVSFHKSAVIVIPIVALAAARNRITSALILGATGILLYYLFVAESVDTLITNYVDAEYNSQGAGVRIATSVVAACIFLFFRRRFALSSQADKIWKNFSIASFVALAFLLASPSSAAVDRLSLYLLPLQLFVFSRIPDVFRLGGKRNPQLLLAVLIYSALVQFVWLNFATHSAFWLPYRLYPFFSAT